jgi:hypothetical protein
MNKVEKNILFRKNYVNRMKMSNYGFLGFNSFDVLLPAQKSRKSRVCTNNGRRRFTSTAVLPNGGAQRVSHVK